MRSGAPTTSTGRRSRARLDDRRDRPLDGVEQGVLHHQVVDRVAGQAQLGEDRDGDALVVAVARLGQHRLRVGGRVGDREGSVQAAMRANPCA